MHARIPGRVRRGNALDLPYPNLVMLVVPVILMTLEMARISLLQLPEGEVASTPVVGPPSIELVLRIGRRGFRVEGDDLDIRIPCVRDNCEGLDSYDLERLTRELRRLKELHPTEDSITIVPEGLVPYQLVLSTMDAAREDGLHRDWRGICPELFPFQVVTAP